MSTTFGFGEIEEVIAWADELPRESVVRLLSQNGFGRPGSAVPTDWREYFHDDELRDFLVASMAFIHDVPS